MLSNLSRLVVWQVLACLCVLALPGPLRAQSDREGAVGRAFIERRFKTDDEKHEDQLRAIKAKIDLMIATEIKGLSSSPNWGPGHAKWREVESAFRAEVEPLFMESTDSAVPGAPQQFDDLVRAYRAALSAGEQAALVKFYSSPLGERLLSANRRMGKLIHDLRVQVFVDPNSLRPPDKPLTPEKQAQWTGDFVLTDHFRVMTTLLALNDGAGFSSYSEFVKFAFAVRGPEFEEIHRGFHQGDHSAIATFQESDLGKKEMQVLSGFAASIVAKEQKDREQRTVRLATLMMNWSKSKELQ